ncbi:MAG: hypothetical protein FWC47_01845 [Oscillospiraceae bacterium]|nr:hypothetical protein [Oscillospiraceae bacterium]
MTWLEYMTGAAKQSRYNARHWFRYLCKVIFEDKSNLTEHDIEELLKSDELTNFQKITLKFAMQDQSDTRKYIVSLNQKAKLKNWENLLEKYGRL